MTHRLAAIGLRHGHAHDLIKGLTKLGSVELIALAEDDEASRRQAETRYEVTGYQDYRELLRQETVDIVTVAAMNNEKADVIPECIRQGKHVLADKPLVISLEDLAEIRNALDGTDSVLSMNLALRFSPAYLRAREIVDEESPLPSSVWPHTSCCPKRERSGNWTAGSTVAFLSMSVFIRSTWRDG